jgi:hypothetical protein
MLDGVQSRDLTSKLGILEVYSRRWGKYQNIKTKGAGATMQNQESGTGLAGIDESYDEDNDAYLFVANHL